MKPFTLDRLAPLNKKIPVEGDNLPVPLLYKERMNWPVLADLRIEVE
jgi:hypothetical protein